MGYKSLWTGIKEKATNAHPDIESVYVSVGSRYVSGGLSLKTKDENLGQISVVIKDRAPRGIRRGTSPCRGRRASAQTP